MVLYKFIALLLTQHFLVHQVHKELEKAIQEERKMRKELAKVKKAEEERKRQV